jgi:hypothetical protein
MGPAMEGMCAESIARGREHYILPLNSMYFTDLPVVHKHTNQVYVYRHTWSLAVSTELPLTVSTLLSTDKGGC